MALDRYVAEEIALDCREGLMSRRDTRVNGSRLAADAAATQAYDALLAWFAKYLA